MELNHEQKIDESVLQKMILRERKIPTAASWSKLFFSCFCEIEHGKEIIQFLF